MNKTKYLYLNSRDEFFRVDITKIVYFESDGNYTNIILNNKMKTTVCMNLAQMQSILSENLKEAAGIFARIGKRHIVNMNYVYQIAILRQKLVLSDGENFEYHVSVSKEALKKLRDMYVSGLSIKTEAGTEKITQ
ncbi:MAG: LytTR family transcriptional regulator [Bacteroides sp.]|nr:LytTR family transcriptional regulator [Bacteroides sp.]MBD5305965.1 LytTR family transcriptional regulator [Bacteroides sp.]